MNSFNHDLFPLVKEIHQFGQTLTPLRLFPAS